MKDNCEINWPGGIVWRSLPAGFVEAASPAPPSDRASSGAITFEVGAVAAVHVEGCIPIPGYDAPALPLKPVRDAALSLIALSGVDPSTPVMVEVPLVQDSINYLKPQTLAGYRIGFADRYQAGSDFAPVEHSAAFLRVLGLLCQAGAQLVPVSAQRRDEHFHFNVQSYNEIDHLVVRHGLDALVSDSHSRAFHAACESGYPSHCEVLEGGMRLWIYGSRGAHKRLKVIVQTCQRLFAAPTVAQPASSG